MVLHPAHVGIEKVGDHAGEERRKREEGVGAERKGAEEEGRRG